MVLRSAQRLHSLARSAGRLVDVTSDRCGADEAHGLDGRVLQQLVDRAGVALHDVENALGKAGLGEEFGRQQRDGRVLLRRLEHEGVPAGDGHRIHPHGDHHGEVERRDASHDTQRLPDAVGVDIGGDLGRDLSLQQARDTAGVLDHFEPPLHFPECVGIDLAVLGADESGQVAPVAVDELPVAEHDVDSSAEGCGLPRLERNGGAGNGGIDVGRFSQTDLTGLVAGGRVEHRRRSCAVPVRPCVVDPVAQLLHSGLPRVARRHALWPDGASVANWRAAAA